MLYDCIYVSHKDRQNVPMSHKSGTLAWDKGPAGYRKGWGGWLYSVSQTLCQPCEYVPLWTLTGWDTEVPLSWQISYFNKMLKSYLLVWCLTPCSCLWDRIPGSYTLKERVILALISVHSWLLQVRAAWQRWVGESSPGKTDRKLKRGAREGEKHFRVTPQGSTSSYRIYLLIVSQC